MITHINNVINHHPKTLNGYVSFTLVFYTVCIFHGECLYFNLYTLKICKTYEYAKYFSRQIEPTFT